MKENIDLVAYVRDNIAFCRTLVVKFEDLALLDNRLIKQYYNIDAGDDKSKWRYYMNLNGEYHVTDQMMTVKSLDDNEIINFTKENLVLHPATKNAYRQGGYYYSRLVDEFAYQRELINGILNPIPISEAIGAPNYKILRYNEDYVHWNEIQLIPDLQAWIDNVAYQWFGTEYKYTDNLMHAALILHMYSSIFQYILTNRYEKRFSRYAHPFYIWSLLQSNGISPIYKDLLNPKQTMWLFRNIDYVLRNLGKQDTFEQLMEILLSERDIPLSKYDMVFDTMDMPVDLSPTAQYQTERLNLKERFGLARTLRTINLTMTKEIPDAYDNDTNYDKYLPLTTLTTRFGEAGNYPIKVLESEMTDTTNRQPETFFHVLNSELIYLAKNDMYDIQIDFTEPLTGNSFTMPVQEAITLWHHLLNIYLGNDDCDKIVAYYYSKAMKIKPPSLKQLMSLGGHPTLEQDWCTDLLKTHIPQYRIISPTAFYQNAKAIFDAKWDQKKMTARFPQIAYYSRRENAASNLYETGYAKLSSYNKYSELIEKYGLELETYSKEDSLILMWEIWRKMTGWDQFTHQTIAELQSGMIGLMKFLSSYSLQYIKQTDVQTGYYQGGLDLLTENPMFLRPDGPQIEIETEDTQIEIPHRVVTSFEEEIKFLGNIEEQGLKGFIETTSTANIYQTPVLFPADIEEDGDDVGKLIEESFKLRPFTGELPWDIDNLKPDGSKYNNDQFTRGMIIDILTGKMKEGPWEVKGIKIVDNGLDNDIIAKELDGYPIPTYTGSKAVDGKMQYTFGFTPARTGDGVVKLDIQLYNSTDKTSSSLRVDYPVNVSQGLWSVILDIPEAINLNESFAISTAYTGLDVKQGERLEVKIKANDEISKYLTFGTDSNGELTGSFIKPGWPQELPVLLTATIYPAGVTSANDVGVRTRYMIGYIPSDRYYDPRYDPDFVPKADVLEGSISAMTAEYFSIIDGKKGWRVTQIKVDPTNDPSLLKKDYVTKYGTAKDFLAPKFDSNPEAIKLNGVDGKKYTFWWASNVLGANTIKMITVLYNDDSKQTLEVQWDYKPKTFDHGLKMEYYLANQSSGGKDWPIGYDSKSTIWVSNITANMVGLNLGFTKINDDPKNPVNITITNPDFNVNAISGITVNPSGELSVDVGLGIKIRCYPKSKVNSGTITAIHYGTTDIAKTRVFDIDDITIKDFDLKPWDNEQWYVDSLVYDRVLMKEGIKGWYISDIRYQKDSNGNYLTPEIRTRLEGITTGKFEALDPLTVQRRYGSDGGVTLPSTHNLVAGIGYVPTTKGTINTKMELVVLNKYVDKTISVPFEWTVNVKDANLQITVDPEFLFKAQTQVHYALKGTDFPPTPATYAESSGAGHWIGSELYTDSYIGLNFVDKLFTWPGYTKRPSLNGGIATWIEAIYSRKDRDISNSVAAIRKYYFRHDYSDDDIMEVPPPKYEDFDFKYEDNNVFIQGAACTGIISYDSDKIYENGWMVHKNTNLTVFGAPDQDERIMTSYEGIDFASTMYGVDVHSLPSGFPAKRSGIYPTITPVKAGKQKFTMEVIAYRAGTARQFKYLYEFEIDAIVMPISLEVVDKDDMWYLINETTTATIQSTVDQTNISTLTSVYAKENPAFSEDITVTPDNSGGSNGRSKIKLKTLRKAADGLKPKVVISQRALMNGYVYNDSRRTRTFFGTVTIDPFKTYSIDEVDIGLLDMKPDIVFDEKLKNQVYTERYLYNKEPRGWYITGLMYRDGMPDWMLQDFEYDGNVVSIPVLNTYSHTTNKDYSITSPEGKMFMFATYGHNVEGKKNFVLKLSLAGRYHTGRATVYYSIDSNGVASEIGFKHEFENNEVVIGKVNNFKTKSSGVPPADLKPWVIGSETFFKAAGKEASSLGLDIVNGKLTVPDSYGGSPFMLVHVAVYQGTRAGEVPADQQRTATWNRYVIGTEIVDDEIKLGREYFNPKIMGLTYKELESVSEHVYFTKAWNGWVVDGVDFEKGERDKYVLNKWNGIDLTTIEWQTTDVSVKSATVEMGYLAIGFVPKEAGTFEYPLKLTATKNGKTLPVSFTTTKVVLPRNTKLPTLDFSLKERVKPTAGVGVPISNSNPLYVGDVDRAGNINYSEVDMNYLVNLSTNGPQQLIGYSNEYIGITFGPSNPIAGRDAYFTGKKVPPADFMYYSRYVGSYGLPKFGKDIYSPTTLRYLPVNMVMETKVEKGWIVDESKITKA